MASSGHAIDELRAEFASIDATVALVEVPRRDHAAEVAEEFRHLHGHVDQDTVDERFGGTRFVYAAVGDQRDLEWPEDEEGAGSWYELDDRLAYLGRRAPRGHAVETDFTWARWRRMMAAHDWRCCYCGARDELGQDHVVSVARGGHDLMGNVVPACRRCNVAKGQRALEEWLGPARLAEVLGRIEAAGRRYGGP